jgi:hypothetical protein
VATNATFLRAANAKRKKSPKRSRAAPNSARTESPGGTVRPAIAYFAWITVVTVVTVA